MKKLAYVVIIIYSVCLLLMSLWYAKILKEREEEEIIKSAEYIFDLLKLFRKWNAIHNGVYLVIDNNTQPNPYLTSPNKIVVTTNNLKLTQVNPAYMIRQLSVLSKKENGLYFKVVSMMPINPHNYPEGIEKQGILELRRGKRKFVVFMKNYTLYMEPLFIRKECLRCHIEQRYKVGDFRGAIAIYLPQVPKVPVGKLSFIFILEIFIVPILFMGLRLGFLYEKQKHMSETDPLTGLLNRRALNKVMEEEFNKAKEHKYPLSVVMCDIDWFKQYNDTYGHQKGDEVLKKVAEVLKKNLRKGWDYAARYGGEEFVIILPNTDKHGAERVVKRIANELEIIGIPHDSSPQKRVTLSFGIATMYPKSSFKSWQELVKKADEALYDAKASGRNTIKVAEE